MNVSQRLEEEIVNVGVPHDGDQVPPFEEYLNDDPAPINPPHLTDENIRTTLIQNSQSITTEAQTATGQAQERDDPS